MRKINNNFFKKSPEIFLSLDSMHYLRVWKIFDIFWPISSLCVKHNPSKRG